MPILRVEQALFDKRWNVSNSTARWSLLNNRKKIYMQTRCVSLLCLPVWMCACRFLRNWSFFFSRTLIATGLFWLSWLPFGFSAEQVSSVEAQRGVKTAHAWELAEKPTRTVQLWSIGCPESDMIGLNQIIYKKTFFFYQSSHTAVLSMPNFFRRITKECYY